MKKNNKVVMPWTKKDMEVFLPYLYKKVRLENKIRKPLTDEEIIEWYNTKPDFKEYADQQLLLRIEKQKEIAGNAGKVGGKVTYEKLRNSGYFESPKWKEILSENGKKMGKIQGKINVESGHLAEISKIMTPKRLKSSIKNGLKGLAKFESMPEDVKHDARSRGGKKSGDIAVKSGQYAEYCRRGYEASAKAAIQRTKLKKQKMYDLLPSNKFILKDVIPMLMENFNEMKCDQMFRRWIKNNDMYECLGKIKGSGNALWYKKRYIKNL